MQNRKPTLKELWNKSEDYQDFVENAHKNGYGSWSIKKVLRTHGSHITDRELDEILNGVGVC